MTNDSLLTLLASFFNVESVEEFILVLFTSTLVVLILVNATYYLIGIWFPHFNGRLYSTIAAIWSLVVAVSAWYGLSPQAGSVLYRALTGVVLWASIFLMVIGVQHFIDRVRSPEKTRL